MIHYKTGMIKKEYIPGIDEVIDRISCLKGRNSYTKEAINHMKNKLDQDEVAYISFEDSNTRGLKGAKNGQSESKEDIMAHIEQSKERQQRALLIPVTEFDIDFYKYKKSFEDINDDMHIIIEKKYAYIGGGASGNKKLMKRFQSIYKDVYRYYGVTKEDVENQTKRYKDVVRTLSM